MTGSSTHPHDRAYALIERLRRLGARRVVVGDIEVDFAPSPPTAPRAETDADRKARERAQHDDDEATLFHSAG